MEPKQWRFYLFSRYKHRAAGKKPNSIHHLKVNGTDITNIPDIANTLTKKLSDNSSADNYCNRFRAHKNQAESHPVKFNSCNNEVYNRLFSMDELRDAIFKFHDTAWWHTLPNAETPSSECYDHSAQ